MKLFSEEERKKNTFINGELVYVPDTKKIYFGDNITAGGIILNPDQKEIEIFCSDGLIKTDQYSFGLGTPSTLSAITINESYSNTHAHKISTTKDRFDQSETNLLVAKALSDHIRLDPHAKFDYEHRHNHDTLNNYKASQHVDHLKIEIIATDGLAGRGNIFKSVVIVLGTPSTLSGSTKNKSFDDTHTHEIQSSPSNNIEDNSTLFLAKGMKLHLEYDHKIHIGKTEPIDDNKIIWFDTKLKIIKIKEDDEWVTF